MTAKIMRKILYIFILGIAGNFLYAAGCSSKQKHISLESAIKAYHEKDFAVAYQQLQQFNNDPLAHYYLGAMFDAGNHVQKNEQKALEHYKFAAINGIPEAAYNVAIYYLNKDKTGQSSLAVAIDYLNMAAKAGLPQACFNLSVIYGNKEEEYYNPEKSKEYLEKAIVQGLPEAFLLRSHYCLKGIIYPRDCKKGIADLNEAVKLGSSEACTTLAFYYENGVYVEKNIEKSFYYTEMAAKLGNTTANCMLGIMYYLGKGTEMNRSRGLEFIKSAAAKNDPYALIVMGLIQEKNSNNIEANTLYQAAKNIIGIHAFSEVYKKYAPYFLKN